MSEVEPRIRPDSPVSQARWLGLPLVALIAAALARRGAPVVRTKEAFVCIFAVLAFLYWRYFSWLAAAWLFFFSDFSREPLQAALTKVLDPGFKFKGVLTDRMVCGKFQGRPITLMNTQDGRGKVRCVVFLECPFRETPLMPSGQGADDPRLKPVLEKLQARPDFLRFSVVAGPSITSLLDGEPLGLANKRGVMLIRGISLDAMDPMDLRQDLETLVEAALHQF